MSPRRQGLLAAGVLVLLIARPAGPASPAGPTGLGGPAGPAAGLASAAGPAGPASAAGPAGPAGPTGPATAGHREMAPAAVPAPATAAGWRAPVAAPVHVLRPFAPGPERWSSGHRGVDLALAEGAPVLAAGRGRVVFAGPVAGRGVVSVAHGDLRTTYEPVLPSVAAGDVVAAGSTLGTLGAGHPGCVACLHWGLRRGGHYLDPLRLLRPVRVRLLPLTAAPP